MLYLRNITNKKLYKKSYKNKMKNLILMLSLCFLTYNAQAQTKKEPKKETKKETKTEVKPEIKIEPKVEVKIDILDKVAKSVCECLNKNKADKDADNLLKTCMTEGFMMNLADVMEKYPDMMSGDPKGSEQMGQDITLKLMKDCPAFVDAASKSSPNASVSKQIADPIETTEGVFSKMETKNYTYLVLEVGVEKQKFVILESFEGEKAVLGQEKALKKKKLAVSWKQRRIFMKKTNTYETVKQITGVK